MKKILLNVSLIFLVIFPFKVFALSTTEDKEKTDIYKNASLTLNYDYEDYIFDNTLVNIYYIAQFTSDYQYILSDEFLEYQIEFNGLHTEYDWEILEQTLNSYIETDNIKEKYSLLITNNKIQISDLKPGLYFIKTDKINNKDYLFLFNDFLLSVPYFNDNGLLDNQIVANVKTEIYTPKYENITYSVTKKWKDSDKNRPRSVSIDIYKDNKLVEKRILSQNNNWTYSWDTVDDGSEWNVVERNVTADYKVSILKNDNNFIIINTSIKEVDNPKTSDNIILFFYLLILSLIGVSLIIINLFIKSKKNGK